MTIIDQNPTPPETHPLVLLWREIWGELAPVARPVFIVTGVCVAALIIGLTVLLLLFMYQTGSVGFY